MQDRLTRSIQFLLVLLRHFTSFKGRTWVRLVRGVTQVEMERSQLVYWQRFYNCDRKSQESMVIKIISQSFFLFFSLKFPFLVGLRNQRDQKNIDIKDENHSRLRD